MLLSCRFSFFFFQSKKLPVNAFLDHIKQSIIGEGGRYVYYKLLWKVPVSSVRFFSCFTWFSENTFKCCAHNGLSKDYSKGCVLWTEFHIMIKYFNTCMHLLTTSICKHNIMYERKPTYLNFCNQLLVEDRDNINISIFYSFLMFRFKKRNEIVGWGREDKSLCF